MPEAKEEYFKKDKESPSEKEVFLGTYGLKNEQDTELLAKLMIEKFQGNDLYASPLLSDEKKEKLK